MSVSTISSRSTRMSVRAWAGLLVLCAAVFLDALDVSMVGVALPTVRDHFHLTTGTLQWVVSAYVLGYGGFLLLGGRAADLFGRRRMFLIDLGVFAVASALGGFATDGTMLIVTRFVKGVSAAFTLPAAFSIITTTFEEGPARNRALSIYVGTIATGYSLGLVLGGLLTELGWRWVFLAPAPVALVTLAVALRVIPAGSGTPAQRGRIDIAGAVSVTAAMLLLVYTLVEAPSAGWGSVRTVGSFVASVALLALFVVIELTVAAPLLRLDILRSRTLLRANLAAMVLAGWIGFQFIAILYMQQYRGWSALESGLAIFPAGLLVAGISPRMAPVIQRFGFVKLTILGLLSQALGYALILQIAGHSSYAAVLLPGFLIGGFGFAISYGPVNVAATSGVPAEEQGLAGGLLNTSFQFGGALILAIVTAIVTAATPIGAAHATLHGYHAALLIPIAADVIGAAGMVQRARRRSRQAPATRDTPAIEIETAARERQLSQAA